MLEAGVRSIFEESESKKPNKLLRPSVNDKLKKLITSGKNVDSVSLSHISELEEENYATPKKKKTLFGVDPQHFRSLQDKDKTNHIN